jgi:hypothetical protein
LGLDRVQLDAFGLYLLAIVLRDLEQADDAKRVRGHRDACGNAATLCRAAVREIKHRATWRRAGRAQ